MKATALLLNWKRSDNLKQTIESIRKQNVPIEIFLWDNNPEGNISFDVDLHIKSNKNLMCWPRWFMANYANSNYVFSLDDDLALGDDKIIEDCIREAGENCAVGAQGKKRVSEQINVLETCFEGDCNMILGRFILMHKNQLGLPPLIPWQTASVRKPRIEDDIIVSSYVCKTKIIKGLHDRLIQLPEGEYSLWKQPDHLQSRKEFSRKFLGNEYRF